MSGGHLNQLEYSFKNYNEQAGKHIRLAARLTAAQTQKLITDETFG